MTIWRMRIVCWTTKATQTLTICNTAFPLQQCLRERALMLRLYILPVLFFVKQLWTVLLTRKSDCNLANNTRAGRGNRQWVLGTLIYEGVKLERGERLVLTSS